MSVGNLPDASQSKRPPSTSTPPMAMPWPPRNLVAEWNTRSAPRSNGRLRYGVVKVESINSGSPWACATSATAGMSSTSQRGLPTVSPKSRRVSGRMAAAKAAGSRGSTKVVSMPKRGSV